MLTVAYKAFHDSAQAMTPGTAPTVVALERTHAEMGMVLEVFLSRRSQLQVDQAVREEKSMCQ